MTAQSSTGPKIAEDLQHLYEDYFDISDFEKRKNQLAAADSVNSICRVFGNTLGNCIDFGAGDGVVTNEIFNRKIATTQTVLEISSSGIKNIKALGIIPDTHILQFDGYALPKFQTKFDTLICSHVIEHVEHERIILRAISDIADNILLIVPLEGGLRGRIDRSGGHINYYTPMTFINLIETSGLNIVSTEIYPSSLTYEKHIDGAARGGIKGRIRQLLLACLGKKATEFMTYNMIVHCKKL